MAYVDFRYKNGTVRRMLERDAKILTKMKKGAYARKDLVADVDYMTSVVTPVDVTTGPEPVADIAGSDGLDSLDAPELHEIAKARGVDVHHRAGADKVRAALREAAE